jgi:hypothetical protein
LTGKELERVRRQPPPPEENPLDVIGALVRLAGTAWLRTAEWGLGASLRMARAAVDPRAGIRMARDTGEEVRGYAREFLGVADLEERVRQLIRTPAAAVPDEDSTIDVLRTRGEALLRASADVNLEQDTHPAYARILDELAPDEARILRLLALEGPQPAVDVRTPQLIGVSSQLVAEGLSMIGLEAGVRYPERVASYLNNLNRLGLIWFSKEPIGDPVRYQVLEAQPDVLGALKSSRRAKSVQRSILLTPFGRDFCEACLPLGDSA